MKKTQKNTQAQSAKKTPKPALKTKAALTKPKKPFEAKPAAQGKSLTKESSSKTVLTASQTRTMKVPATKSEAISPTDSKKKLEKPVTQHRHAKRTKDQIKTIRKRQKQIKQKHKPSFLRRRGPRSVKRLTNKKWFKWRKPRGIDIQRKQNYGAKPDSGYRTPNTVRGLHPSGWPEFRVFNAQQVQTAPPNAVLRVGAGVGAKKRKEIIRAAVEQKRIVVN